MNQHVPAFLVQAAAKEERQIDPQAMEQIRAGMAKVRVLELQKRQAEDDLAAAKRELNRMLQVVLPDNFDAAGITAFELGAIDNQPGIRAELKPYYSANIAGSWNEEKRSAAFNYLESLEAGDLIKTQLSVSLPQGCWDQAQLLASLIEAQGFQPEVKQSVPHTSLTAWLKEQVERHNFTPDLAKIGGAVGRVVKISVEKDSAL